MMLSNQRNLAILSIFVSAGIWGLFWIPLRYLDENGIPGFWAIALVSAFSLIPTLAIALWNKEFRRHDTGSILTIGIGIGLAMSLYFIGIILSDVIRVIFLFYLLPVWSALIAKFVLGEKLGPVRTVCILAALGGVWLLLGEGVGLPVPRNIGDWCGLASGLIWAICLILIRQKNEVGTFASISATFIFGAIFSLVLAFMFDGGADQFNNILASDNLGFLLSIAIGFGVLVMLPAMAGQVWGAHYIEAPLAALLTMSEIIFATISAWYLIGTSLSPGAIFGGLVIVFSVAVDLAYQYRTARLDT